MNNKIAILLTIALLVGGAYFFWPSDEKKINGKLASLAEYCSSDPSEPVIKALQNSTLAAKLCSDPCTVRFESLHIDRQFTRKEFADRLLMMKKRLPDVRFSFHDTSINIPPDNRAEIITTLRLNGNTGNGDFTDAYEINISAEKRSGDWLFSSFTVVEFMKK